MLDIRRRTGSLLLVLLVGHVILISAQVPARSGPRLLQVLVLGTFAEAERLLAGAAALAAAAWHRYVALRQVGEENEALRRQIAELEVQLQAERAVAREAARLQRLLDLKSSIGLPTLAARVIAGNPTPGFHTITIDRGARDGVRRDLAVIGPNGVIGRTVGEPAARAAQVQLIVAREAAAGALVERSQAGGVVMGGGGDPPLTLEYVTNLADVREGDLVVTSGLDGIYPRGLPIGRVTSAARGPALYQIIKVRPLVDFSSLDHVLVVLVSPGAEGRP
jgi:rod shape-determining protein MreC